MNCSEDNCQIDQCPGANCQVDQYLGEVDQYSRANCLVDQYPGANCQVDQCPVGELSGKRTVRLQDLSTTGHWST